MTAAVVAVLATLLALLAPFDRPAEAQRTYPFACNGGGVVTRGAWTVMPIPGFPDGAGGQQARHHAVAADRPSTIYVTNGTSVLRTTDGGCNWAPVYELGAGGSPYPEETAQIVDVAVPRGGDDRIYLVVMEAGRAGEGLPGAEGATPVVPHIVASFDGGRSWTSYDTGLQPIARDTGDGSSGYCGQVSGCMLEFSPTNREVGYLALSVSDGAPGVLYATVSGGRGGWEPRSVPGDATDPEPVQGIEQLAVDPVDPSRVWIDNGGLAVSSDAGSSWTGVDDGTDGFRVALDVALDRGERRTLVLASGQRSVPAPVDHAAIGTAGGMQPIPGAMGLAGVRIDSADHGADASQTVAAGPDGVYALGDTGAVQVDEQLVSSYGPARDVQGIVHPEVEAYAMLGTGAVLVYHPTEPPPPPEPELPPLEVPPPPEPEPISLSPHGAQVEVDPGATATVDYELDLPARPIPVDVFFLLDSSFTMGPLIQGLAQGLDQLVRQLIAAQMDVQFGLADFNDSRSDGVRYRRRVDISRPSQELQHSLSSIEEHGGVEPHLTALDQMVTGSGILNPSRGREVQPGQDATWRPGSVRIAVIATNEPYGQPPGYAEYCYDDNTQYEDPDGPSEATAMAHLREDRVRLIGIEYEYDPRYNNGGEINPKEELCMAQRPSGRSPVRVQLDRWSKATGAVVPRGGIDCNGDGDVDLHEGDSLACTLPKDAGSDVVEITDPLVRLILSLEQPRPVEVTAASEGGATVSVQPASDFSAVDVRSDHLLGFTATFSCTPDQAGRQLPVTLTATLAGAQVAQAPATVLCGPQPAEDVPPPEVPQPGAPAPPPPAAPPALAGPPPAPAPVAAGAPAAAQAQAAATGSAAAAVPVVAPGLAPGGAVVDAGPAEAQVRLAHNQAQNHRAQDRQAQGRTAARGERLMLASAYGQDDEPLPIVTWGAAALLFGAGAAVARRRDTRSAEIR